MLLSSPWGSLILGAKHHFQRVISHHRGAASPSSCCFKHILVSTNTSMDIQIRCVLSAQPWAIIPPFPMEYRGFGCSDQLSTRGALRYFAALVKLKTTSNEMVFYMQMHVVQLSKKKKVARDVLLYSSTVFCNCNCDFICEIFDRK